MALPTLAKTWQLDINRQITAQGSTLATNRRILRTIKDRLKAFGSGAWTVSSSSNSVVANSSDNWTTDADLVFANEGSVHSWIVLRQVGIAANFEICMNLTLSGSGANMQFVISPSAAFTGGTTSNRPTATDEIIQLNSAPWSAGGDVQTVIHIWQSTDGQVMHFMALQNNAYITYCHCSKPASPVSGWTNPSLAGIVNAGPAFATLGSTSILRGKGVSGTSFTVKGTGPSVAGASSQILPFTIAGYVNQNDFDNTHPLAAVGLFSDTTGNRGSLGYMFDCWWTPTDCTQATTLPNSGTVKQFVCWNNITLPWTNDSTIPLTA